MNIIETVVISGLTTFALATFSSVATFFVNRYMPRILDHIEKKVKKPLDK